MKIIISVVWVTLFALGGSFLDSVETDGYVYSLYGIFSYMALDFTFKFLDSHK